MSLDSKTSERPWKRESKGKIRSQIQTDVLLNCENVAYFIPHYDSVLFCAPMPVILTKIKT